MPPNIFLMPAPSAARPRGCSFPSLRQQPRLGRRRHHAASHQRRQAVLRHLVAGAEGRVVLALGEAEVLERVAEPRQLRVELRRLHQQRGLHDAAAPQDAHVVVHRHRAIGLVLHQRRPLQVARGRVVVRLDLPAGQLQLIEALLLELLVGRVLVLAQRAEHLVGVQRVLVVVLHEADRVELEDHRRLAVEDDADLLAGHQVAGLLHHVLRHLGVAEDGALGHLQLGVGAHRHLRRAGRHARRQRLVGVLLGRLLLHLGGVGLLLVGARRRRGSPGGEGKDGEEGGEAQGPVHGGGP